MQQNVQIVEYVILPQVYVNVLVVIQMIIVILKML